MKLCKDCKYWQGARPLWLLGCLPSFCSKEDGVNPVTGKTLIKKPILTALKLRQDESKCGQEARWFEDRVRA